MVSDISNVVREITTTLMPIDWRWDKNFWIEIATSLGLIEKERMRGRITYSFLNDQELSVYFDDQDQERLQRLEIPIFVHWETELMPEAEYEEIFNNFSTIYEKAVNAIISVLGSAKFKGDLKTPGFPDYYDVLKIAIWNIQNAHFIIYIEHQDPDVPIVIAVGVEPGF